MQEIYKEWQIDFFEDQKIYRAIKGGMIETDPDIDKLKEKLDAFDTINQ